MARTEVTKVKPTDAGVNPTPNTGTVDGHMYTANGDEVLVVRNTGASARTFSIVTPRAVEGLNVPDQTVSVPAGGTRYIGDIEPGIYAQPSGADRGKVYVNYDVAAPAELNLIVLDAPKAD